MALSTAIVSCGSSGKNPASAEAADDPAPVFTDAEIAALRALSPKTLPSAPPDSSNRFAEDAKAAAFGQKLFFEKRFSGMLLDPDNDGSSNALGNVSDVHRVSCAGCHLPHSAFTDTRSVRQQISLAAGWGRRRAPSLLDVAHSLLLMWDGHRDSLYNQAIGVFESAVEMNSSRLYVAQQVFALHRDEYESIFGNLPALDDSERFPPLEAEQTGCRKLDASNACTAPLRGAPGDGAEFDGLSEADKIEITRINVNVGKALGAYQRLLSCGQSRFDRWVHGDDRALSPAEQRGAALFVGRAQCVNCHSGPFLSDEQFHNVGLQATFVATAFINPEDPGAAEGLVAAQGDPLNVNGMYSDGDDGRLPDAVGDEMLGAFRTPKLRCVAQRPSFMHTGQFRKLEDVVDFFARGGDRGGFLGENELERLELSSRDRADLVAFLRALDGPGPEAHLLEE
jgi:cytochrome c peroxidase